MHSFFHYGDQLPFALQVSLGIICVFCVLTHVVVKKPFCLSRMYTPFPWGCTHSIKAPRLGLGGHRPAAKFIGEMTMKFSSFKVLFFKLYKRFWRVIIKTFFFYTRCILKVSYPQWKPCFLPLGVLAYRVYTSFLLGAHTVSKPWGWGLVVIDLPANL